VGRARRAARPGAAVPVRRRARRQPCAPPASRPAAHSCALLSRPGSWRQHQHAPHVRACLTASAAQAWALWGRQQGARARARVGAHSGQLAGQGVLLAAAAKTGLALLDARGGGVLAALDSAGLVNHGAALSADGRLFAAATFTADVKARAPGRPPLHSPTAASGAAGRGAARCRPSSSCCCASG